MVTSPQYQRAGSVPDLEADFGMIRASRLALIARSLRLRLGAVIGLFGALVGVGVWSSGTSYEGGAALVLVSGVTALVLWIMSMGQSPVRLDKLEAVSGLLRRCEWLAGAPVTVTADLALGFGRQLSAQQVSGNASDNVHRLIDEDAWLVVEGQLANHVAVRISRRVTAHRSVRFWMVRRGRSLQQTSRTLSETYSIVDSVELRFDPTRNPALLNAGATVASRLWLRDGDTILNGYNQPGSLAFFVARAARPAFVHQPDEIASLTAQVVALVDRSRPVVRAENAASPAAYVSAAELEAATGSAAPRVPPGLMVNVVAGLMVIASFALLLVGAQFHRRAVDWQDRGSEIDTPDWKQTSARQIDELDSLTLLCVIGGVAGLGAAATLLAVRRGRRQRLLAVAA